MRRVEVVVLMAAFFFFFMSCGRNPSVPLGLFRFVDALKAENIVLSPLIVPAQDAGSSLTRFPIKSSPLLDKGTGENPYDLKRKIKVFRETLNTLFAPPDSRFDFSLRSGGGRRLEVGFGVITDERSKKMGGEADERGSVHFSVALERKEGTTQLLKETLRVPTLEEGQVYEQRVLDLPVFSGKAVLVFETSGETGAFSFWADPVILPEGNNFRNVILISIDTLRADHLGVYGYGRETSPSIDALAADSALFTHVYASSPWTLSSHVSMLTALHCVHHRVYQENEKMSSDLDTAAELLRLNGMYCAAFTGGGFVSSVFGFAEGFDSYYERTDEVLLDRAAELGFRDVGRWLDGHGNRNFFLFVHSYQPHDPYACPAPFKTMFLSDDALWSNINLNGHLGGKKGIFKPLPERERRNIIDLYDAEIRYTDEALIGPLVQKLKDMNLYDETMIIFTSDHGEEFYDHGGWGHGHSLYDESLRVPLIIKFPNSRFAGAKVGKTASLVDIVPTILEEMGSRIRSPNLDGMSLIPLLEGREKGERTVFSDVGENILDLHLPQKIASNEGRIKLILNKSLRREERNFFTVPPPAARNVELFDLSDDPGETKNIVDDKSTEAQLILSRIEKIYSEVKGRNPESVVLDDALKQQLRALGYIK